MDTNEEIQSIKWVFPGDPKQYTTPEISKKIHEYTKVPGYKYDIAIGTDSQMIGKVFQFISVVSVHRVGKGGIYFYYKKHIPREKFPLKNQKMRMFDEVAKSIALALYMKDEQKIVASIHADASPAHKKQEFTAKFSEQLRGYVVSCGFEFMLKPESYAAHAIADKHTKKKSRGRRRQRHIKR